MDRNERLGAAAATMKDFVARTETFRTSAVKRVPTRSYTDPDQRKAEIELGVPPLAPTPASPAELPRPGDFKAMDAVGLPVLINRDKACTVRAFLNVCPHRGAPVASEGHGNCPRFTCKYHGWTFRQDGLADRRCRGKLVRRGRQGRAWPSRTACRRACGHDLRFAHARCADWISTASPAATSMISARWALPNGPARQPRDRGR
jgi:hypothetical protein